ncbi:ornithine carbamoyltransferase [Shouchella lehensis]|uniref:Ornithine carbamoyltransferase n=1 Tax=Shouchella lehensis TaxID=300825 RepID=A0A4Y7WRC2_9BACI|nr:ornithine carbamoyltransferase [Shouchella lehensis]MBG9784062.1 ornithine carbamoyltransferase [Shouchella lehensis]RQW20938.1 ornithine carbamoyltransferase [Bacillus sp. C1-1]TES50961.1 ornithine carbamoyltransferase [Shouchella lehensis]
MQSTAINLTGKHMLTLLDYTVEEIDFLLTKASELKQETQKGEVNEGLRGKSLGMIFENASTRTRVSFEVGMTQLGGHALFLSPKDLQIGRGEPIKDTANVLSRYVDAIMIRTNSHQTVEEFATHATVPVINALTDAYHPCQALADALTIKEKKGDLKGLTLVYVGDGNNVAHSLMAVGAKTGMNVTISSPKGYEVDSDVFARAKEQAKGTGAIIQVEEDPFVAAKGADIIYTDVWTSMGYENEQSKHSQDLKPYQVNEELMAVADSKALFMHCLPAHRDEEVTSGVIDGAQSVVYDQAENRLHVQKAILASVISHN